LGSRDHNTASHLHDVYDLPDAERVVADVAARER
jgi:hypothetical protein